MPQVQSAVNGLVINIPAQAKGLLGRFATQGDNRLVFVSQRGVVPADAPNGVNKKQAVKFEPVAADPEPEASDLA